MLRSKQDLPVLALALSVVALATTGCSDDGKPAKGPPDSEDSTPLDAPTNAAELDTFLELRSYLRWRGEPALHAGRGPHGRDVRVFYSPKAADALTASAAEFPRGAAVVKEIRAENSSGWAVWVKGADDSDNGNGFYWYELIVAVDSTRKVYGDSFGAPGCVGCHSSGRDFLLADGTFE